MKTVALGGLLIAFAAIGFSQQAKELLWAYPVPDKAPPSADDKSPRHIPGSSKAYTQQQIDDQFNPPDWFPEEHGPLPRLLTRGVQAQACGSCHLTSGSGHPESADLAGQPLEYMLRQMADFKNDLRKDAMGYDASQRAARMNNIAAGIPDEEMRQAVRYFASLKPQVWYKVIEAQTVPRTWVNGGRMRLPLPDGGTEPLGHRIVTLPQDPARTESRDPHSGFIAYVPPGSIRKGEELVKKENCALCHGEGLKGLGDNPRIAGVHPIYVMRQLYDIQSGANTSSAAAPMKKVVEKLTQDDMIAIAAYTGSLAP